MSSLIPATPRPRRRPSLTPMIDVVFLLLVFFMLASRFGLDATLPLALADGGDGYDGQPRVLDISAEGLRLNGVPVVEPQVVAAVRAITDQPEDTLVLRGETGVDLQRVVTVADTLRRAGFTQLVLIE